MKRGVNRVIIIGNLGDDPLMRSTQSGDQVATISVATSEEWTDKSSGEKKSKTEWHRVVFFKKLADIAGQYLKKGAKVYVEGSLHTRKWMDQHGVERYTTEIIGSEMQMLDSLQDGGSSNSYQQPAQQARQPVQNTVRQQAPQQQPIYDDFDDQDIPF